MTTKPGRQLTLVPALPADLCLSFANTLSWRGSEPPTEALQDLADLLAWLSRSTGVALRATRQVASWARRHEEPAANLFAEVIALREAVFRIFEALAADDPVREPDFAALSRSLTQAPARRRLVRSNKAYGWRLEPLEPTMPSLLAPVLWSAADLLIAGERTHVRQCANDKCRWLFLDESKNGSRRWCDMASCGNRAKARRHYLRKSRS